MESTIEKREKALKVLERLSSFFNKEQGGGVKGNPFLVLLSALLSHRTKDEVTEAVTERIASRIKGPKDVLKMDIKTLESLLYPCGFYRKKAKILKEVSKVLLEKYNGEVPDSLEELLKIKGVGRKTANLVIAKAYGKNGLAVDTHVHRISKRLGLVNSKSERETEEALKALYPARFWASINSLFVHFGKNICRPISPFCSLCPLLDLCDKVGLNRWR